MATPAELEAALVNADKAGDVDAARVLAAEIQRMRAQAQPAAPTVAAPSAPTTIQKVQASAPMRLIQGMRDPIDAGAQLVSHLVPDSVTAAIDKPFAAMRNSDSPLLQTIGETFFADPRSGAVDKAITDNEQRYQAAREATADPTLSSLVTGKKDPGFDAMRFTGNVVSPANAAVARVILMGGAQTALNRALTGGVVGAVGGLEQPVTDPQAQEEFFKAKGIQAGVGAVTGAVLTPAMGAVVDKVAPKVSALLERLAAPERTGARAQAYTDQIIDQALKEVGQSADNLPNGYIEQLRAQVAQSLQTGKQLDVAALMRKQDFEKLNVPPTLGAVTRDPTQFARERNLRAVPNTGEPLLNTFNAQNQRLQQIVGGYGGPQAQESQRAGSMLVKALTDTDEAMRGKVSAAYKAARESTGKELEVPLQGLAQDAANVVRDYGKANVPQAIRASLSDFGIFGGKQTKVFTVEDAEQVLQQINKLYDPARKAEASALDALRGALKRSLTESVEGGGVFAPAREAAAARFKIQDAVPALKSVVEGKASPDAFVSRYIVNGETADVQALAGMLKQTNPQAFAEARNQIGATLQRAAFGENVAGDKIFSAERFAKALREIGTDKLSAFYTPQEIEQLQRISRVGAYINQHPTAAPVMGNPNMAWAGTLLNMIPGASTTLRLLAAGRNAVRNASDVEAAMAAKVPQGAAELPPEVARRLNQALLLGATGAGQAGGAALR